VKVRPSLGPEKPCSQASLADTQRSCREPA
jgi:hypothetical protein